MKLKTTMRYYYTPTRMAKILKIEKTTKQGHVLLKKGSSRSSLWQQVWWFLTQWNPHLPGDPVLLIPGIWSSRVKPNVYTHMQIICKLYANTHSRFICHCENWEQPKWPSISEWVASCAAPTQGTLLTVRRSSYWSTQPCGKNLRWFCSEKEPDSQGSILYDSM